MAGFFFRRNPGEDGGGAKPSKTLGSSKFQFGLSKVLSLLSSHSVVSSSATPMDCSLQGSSVHGISQARILEWVAISISRGAS